MARLVDAHARCRGPEDAGEPPLDLAGFKRLVRDLDLWCSSCLLATEGDEPVGVLFGAKRDTATLVHTVRVHPAHRRLGHARHLLTSLSQKLAILGPPRLVAEVPAEREPARALLAACGWRVEEPLVDWTRAAAGAVEEPPPAGEPPIAPITAVEAVASGLLAGESAAWHRDPAALARAAESPAGLGFYSPERLEACVLYRLDGGGGELLALGASAGEIGRAALGLLVAAAARAAGGELRMRRVAAGEPAAAHLGALGFAAEVEHLRFATEARAA